MTFTDAEVEYLRSQTLGRFCTLGPTGAPQARPVGVHLGPDGTVDVVGWGLAESQKWRNVRGDPRVTFVVDDLVSRKPWRVRGVEIRGEAETIVGSDGSDGGMSGDVIRIHPRRVLSWGLEKGEPEGLRARDVES